MVVTLGKGGWAHQSCPAQVIHATPTTETGSHRPCALPLMIIALAQSGFVFFGNWFKVWGATIVCVLLGTTLFSLFATSCWRQLPQATHTHTHTQNVGSPINLRWVSPTWCSVDWELQLELRLVVCWEVVLSHARPVMPRFFGTLCYSSSWSLPLFL